MIYTNEYIINNDIYVNKNHLNSSQDIPGSAMNTGTEFCHTEVSGIKNSITLD